MGTITNYDLLFNKYTIEELTTNILYLSMTDIVKTQTLTPDFCVRYILNEYYMDCCEEVYRLNFWYVLQKQLHISEKELDDAFDKYLNEKADDSESDNEING
jgi:hypothetical protein